MRVDLRLHHVGLYSTHGPKNAAMLQQALQIACPTQDNDRTIMKAGGGQLEWHDRAKMADDKLHQTARECAIHHIAFVTNELTKIYEELVSQEVSLAWELGEIGPNSFAIFDDTGTVVEIFSEQYSAATIPRPASAQFHHVNILTDNWRRTRDFYQNILGLSVVMEYVDEDDGAFLFLADSHFDLKAHNVLLEITGPPFAEVREHAFFARHGAGLDHVCYVVDDVDQAWDALIAAGAISLAKPYDAYGSRLAWVQDFDGTDIELMLPIPAHFFTVEGDD